MLVTAGFRLRQAYVGLVTRPDKGGLTTAAEGLGGPP